MTHNNILKYAILTSLAIHIGLIVVLSIKLKQLEKQKIRQMTVVYKKMKTAVEKPSQKTIKKVDVPIENKKEVSKVDILSKNDNMMKPMENNIKDVSKFSKEAMADQKLNPALGLMDMGRMIDIPMLKSEKITNPKYLSYNDMIRQKIRQRAYVYIDNPDFEAGEVYLTFVVLANGSLSQVKVIPEKSKGSKYVQSIGVRSIQESSPFPPFPKDLNYPELTFNVVISFKLSK